MEKDEKKDCVLQRRKEWLDAMLRIASPVLTALAEGKLKKTMPLEFHSGRADFAPLEAFGRTMLGLAPWLEADTVLEEERQQQEKMRHLARLAIEKATDPESADFMNFTTGGQPLVDAAFLAHALVRAPGQLAGRLSDSVRKNLADAFRSSRQIVAYNCNWIFFSAMVEAGLYVLGEDYDRMRVISAMRTFNSWYKGDGVYGDGERFHWDYYNSFVIQPMYVDLCRLFADESAEIASFLPQVQARAARYAGELERMIGPDGSYPVIGRSICYRFGAFQALSQAALQHNLPDGVSAGSVRSALTAVMRRILAFPEMFDEAGWLRPGVCGYQPYLAEEYINIGSLYLCTAFFLPLGLKPSDPFWSEEEESWSGKKVWQGGCIPIDHAID